ncbi:uncharacterized protein PGTG_13010 [Puccinia graminis f. sp. tritici CRL 75-36-700-3]|uniref:Uncharacterized protein n=1 Tax=Puccinia graminis f. sp. tritici (strain CRL 75-36-700-3 / race SCCL) TaxID=418459 RepID=E3KQQ3_PUCGT|nr:uncharacterized protein PGTG_13010 [Puccinia graminis f. sp. tritici CRL 75-36-700-3]EFP86628.1 hypothetical protein PGTG_13010 [Puccinia graminis f. sp. tritici CRL 75-36-700-3]
MRKEDFHNCCLSLGGRSTGQVLVPDFSVAEDLPPKIKQKQWPPTPPPTVQTHKVINLEEEEIESSQGGKVSGSGKRSWVWNHFKEDKGSKQAICQVVTKKGNICGKSLNKDKSRSTKTFHAHLFSFHCLVDPNLSKNTKVNHMDLKKWAKSGTLEPKASFNFS